MEWWVWLLIAVGVLLVIGLIIFLVTRSAPKPIEIETINRYPVQRMPLPQINGLQSMSPELPSARPVY